MLWKATSDWTHVDNASDGGDLENRVQNLRQCNKEYRYRIGTPQPSKFMTEEQLVAVNTVGIYRKAKENNPSS